MMNPYVKSVKPRANHRLELVFENGERRIFDVRPYLERSVFARLHNTAVFRAARVVAGSVEWPGEIDLSYDTLYLESQPLEVVGAASPAMDTGEELHSYPDLDTLFTTLDAAAYAPDENS